MLEEQRLDSKVHDCAAFDCGTPVLNECLVRFATQHRRRGIAQIYVLVDSSLPSSVFGYYTLSAAEVHTAQITDADRKRLPRFPVPCFRMGRLAVHRDHKGGVWARFFSAWRWTVVFTRRKRWRPMP